MTVYNLDKGLDNDINGDILRDWLNTNKENIHNLTIRDKGIATIEDLTGLIGSANNLISVDLSNMNTSNVYRATWLITYCNNLTSVSNFNTINVTDMSGMFADCPSLINIPQFNTSNVTNISYMLRNCTNLTDIPQFNTSNVTSMSCAFQGCNNLTNTSIQNIINMCLNSNVSSGNLNTSYWASPLSETKFDNSYYQNRWSELTNAGWVY